MQAAITRNLEPSPLRTHLIRLSGLELTMRCIDDIREFRHLGGEWLELYRSLNTVTPFNSWEWLFSWWQAYGEDKRLRLLIWRRRQALVAVLPLYLSLERTGRALKSRVLRFIGDGSFDSDYLDLIARPAVYSTVIEQFGRWLTENDEWDLLILREMQETSPLPVAVQSLARRSGYPCRCEQSRCGAVALPGSFAVFLQERPSRFRTKLRSLLKTLAAEQNKLAFEDHNRSVQLRWRLRSLFALHQMRWQQAGEPGVFGKRAKRMFYAHFAPRFSRNGWLRFYSLRQGKGYLAHQLCFADRDTTYLLQEGFDVSNAAASYGQMLRAAVVRRLIERGERRYDFLGGFSEHKADWGAQEGRVVHCVVANNHWRAKLCFYLPAWRDCLISCARQLIPPRVIEMIKDWKQRLRPA